VLQVLFFFIPGTFCEVMPTRYALHERDARLSLSHVPRPSLGKKSTTHELEERAHARSGGSDHEDGSGRETMAEEYEWDDYENVADEVAMREEGGLEDLLSDLLSVRFIYFFFIPKIKFTIHLVFHVGYIVFLMLAVNDDRLENGGQLPQQINDFEVIFWVWTAARTLGEIKEVDSFDYHGLTAYLSSNWNKVDLALCASVGSVVFLRLECRDYDPDFPTDCTAYTVWARNLYALSMIMVSIRSMQFVIELSEQVGVQVIILGEMLLNDVRAFSWLVIIMSLGFGFAFKCVMPNNQAVYASTFTNPIFIPLWALVGAPPDIEQVAGYENLLAHEEPTQQIFAALMWGYLFVATLVLVNLLIAAMTSTYERVKEDSRLYWQFERTKVILEFKDTKGALPPPLNLITLVCYDVPRLLLRGCMRFWVRRVHPEGEGPGFEQEHSGFKAIPSLSKLHSLRIAELRARRKFLQQQSDRHALMIDARVDDMRVELDGLRRETRTSLLSLAERQDTRDKATSAMLESILESVDLMSGRRDSCASRS